MARKFSEENVECGKRLKEIRDNAGLKQRAFARKLEVAPSTISETETGNNKPGYDLLLHLVKVFNVNPLYMLTGKGNPYMDADTLNLEKFNFGDQGAEVVQLVTMMDKSPILRGALLAYGNIFHQSNKELINMDISTNMKKRELEKEKQAQRLQEKNNDDTI
jgi:DNA-binding XRE family transcriptional regulator